MNHPPVRLSTDPRDELGYRTLTRIPAERRGEIVVRLNGEPVELSGVLMVDEFEGVVRRIARRSSFAGFAFENLRGQVEVVLPRGVRA